ncbi:hypothetical protein BTVI_56048 [Pitangus sulphuratus]|nr:hypothetical protein BTVI_56048 [Pitangus sulphuratus]
MEMLPWNRAKVALADWESPLAVPAWNAGKGDVIEFHGAEGTGKTEMLYHLIARCIIPKSGGGLEVEVMFIDTDYHFDMLRLGNLTIVDLQALPNWEYGFHYVDAL